MIGTSAFRMCPEFTGSEWIRRRWREAISCEVESPNDEWKP